MTQELGPLSQGQVAVETFHLLTLVGYATEDIAAVSRSKVFELLLQLSYEDVERYRSDYFHDARWLAEHFNTVPFAFLYCWNEHGTRISAHTLVHGRSPRGGVNERVARVVVRFEEHQVLVDVLRVDAAAAEPISATDVAK